MQIIVCYLSLIVYASFPCRDDPELDKILKDRLRWGDPMAHLVKVLEVIFVGFKHNFTQEKFLVQRS